MGTVDVKHLKWCSMWNQLKISLNIKSFNFVSLVDKIWLCFFINFILIFFFNVRDKVCQETLRIWFFKRFTFFQISKSEVSTWESVAKLE